MSVCTFIASDFPLPLVSPAYDYPIYINVDDGTIYDGGADDNFSLISFNSTDFYTNKKYGVVLEWHYTDGRANKLLEYIKNNLHNSDCVELWHVWLMDYYDYTERPVIHKRTVSVEDLTVSDIKELTESRIWNNKNSDRPSFYCINIVK